MTCTLRNHTFIYIYQPLASKTYLDCLIGPNFELVLNNLINKVWWYVDKWMAKSLKVASHVRSWVKSECKSRARDPMSWVVLNLFKYSFINIYPICPNPILNHLNFLGWPNIPPFPCSSTCFLCSIFSFSILKV